MNPAARMLRHSSWVVAVVTLVGCVPESREERLDPAAVCDGSSGLRVATSYGGGGPLGPFDVFSQQFGWSAVYVDGQCRFWTDADHLEIRTGTLTTEEWAALAQRLGYPEWQRWSGEHGTQLPDLGARMFWTGTPEEPLAQVLAYSVCHSSDGLVPPGLCDATRASAEISNELAARGAAVDGDVWIAVEALSDDHGAAVHPWPVPGVDLAVVAASASTYDVGRQRLGAEDASRVRQLRTTAFQGARAHETTFIVKDAAERLFRIAVRDAVPFEDEDGEVRLP